MTGENKAKQPAALLINKEGGFAAKTHGPDRAEWTLFRHTAAHRHANRGLSAVRRNRTRAAERRIGDVRRPAICKSLRVGGNPQYHPCRYTVSGLERLEGPSVGAIAAAPAGPPIRLQDYSQPDDHLSPV